MREPVNNTVAIVGIDGSGKSTVLRRFIELTPAAGALAMTCPRYHETADAPFAELSRHLDRVSSISDELGSHALKLVAMYYQMTLFGPVEQFFHTAYRPPVLVVEHHALIDTLAYGPLYGDVVAGVVDPELEAPLRERLGDDADATLAAIHRWVAHENRRLGADLTLWGAAEHALELLRLPPDEAIAAFAPYYRTSLPGAVVLLDVPVDVALDRLAARDAALEPHEQAPLLEGLRSAYHAVIDYLQRAHPQVRAVIIDTARARGGDRDLDDTLAEVIAATTA